MRLQLWIWAVAAVLAFGASAAQKDSASKEGFVRAKLRTPATPIEDFPDRRRDAYLNVRIRVNEKGEVSDVEVEDGAFADPQTIDMTIGHVKSFRFVPATDNGVPVPFVAKLGFIFYKDDITTGLGKTFQKELDKLDGYFSAGDQAGGRAHAKEMLWNVVTTRYECVYLQGALAVNELRVGNVNRAIGGLRASTSWSGGGGNILVRPEDPVPGGGDPENYLLPERNYLAMQLELLMRAAAARGMLLEAQSAYRQLDALTPISTNDPRAAVYKAIQNGLQGTAPLQANVDLDDSGSWKHYLYRTRFRIEQIHGSIERAELICDGRPRTLEYSHQVDLAIPDGWKSCSVHIKGAPGTKFVIAEYADIAATAPALPASVE